MVDQKAGKMESQVTESSKKTEKGAAGRPQFVLIPDEPWAEAEDYKWNHRIPSINEGVRQALESFLSRS